MTKSDAYAEFYYQVEDLKEQLVLAFRAGQPLTWPVVPKQLLHRVWLAFSNSGRVSDERALANILSSMRSSLAHLTVATIVAEHTELSRGVFLDGLMTDEEELEQFTSWLLDDDSGYWRISDYGLGPLTDAIVLAMATTKLPEQLKYLDRALNVVHQRGDLARLFVEGGRQSVIDLAEA